MVERLQPTPREVLRASQVLRNGNVVTYAISLGNIAAPRQIDAIVRPAGYLGNGNSNIQGGVEKAILEGAGAGVYDEERAISAEERIFDNEFGQKLGNLVVTSAGNLQTYGVKNIFHVMCHRSDNFAVDEKAIASSVESVLNKVEKMGITSVAFPVMGTGVSKRDGLPFGSAIRATTDAMELFFARHPKTTVKKVEIVAYPHEGLSTGKEIKKAIQGAHKISEGGILRRFRHATLSVAQQFKEV